MPPSGDMMQGSEATVRTNPMLRILACQVIVALSGSAGAEPAWGESTPPASDTGSSSEVLLSYAGERWQRRAEGFRSPEDISHTQFGTITNIVTSAQQMANVAAGDLNGDGRVDIVVGSRTPSSVRAFFNPGPGGGNWTALSVSTAVDDPLDVQIADFDGDGDLDLASASSNSDTIDWFENLNGDGLTWTKRVISTSATGSRAIFPADMDGDGDMDLAAGHFLGEETVWYENADGDGSDWITHVVSTHCRRPDKFVVADFDGDGDMDMITSCRVPHGVYWLENTNGLATAWVVHTITNNILWPRAVAVGDVDGDGDLDVASGSRNDDMIAWYENNGASPPGFAMHVLVDNLPGYNLELSCDPCAPECGFADGANDVHFVDLDLDGDLDLVASATHADRTFWFENNAPGGPKWTLRNLANPGNPRELAIADFDGDGDLDVVYVNRLEARPGPTAIPGRGARWVENVLEPGPAPFFTGECSDEVDNDADCQIDYPNDSGCASLFTREAPACNDHLDNDGDGLIDLDDPGCNGNVWQDSESPKACGLGYELAIMVPLVAWRHRRRRRSPS
jgi:hypothetical protein